jgi:hypothetical protein
MKVYFEMIRRFLTGLVFVCCLSTRLYAENRVALVIGNGKYQSTPLNNPPNDANDMAKNLEGLGFTVIKGIDADYRQMISYIRSFQNMLNKPETVALFYYSGHGIQVNGKNYLIPANADIQNPDEIEAFAVQTDFIYNKLQNDNVKTSIIILDACRNNPFPGAERSAERGLSIQGKFPSQSIIIYSTGPNQTAKDGTGRNGTFTSALMEHLNDPMDIELMLRSVRDEVSKETDGAQIPWTNSSLTGGFSFIKGAAGMAYKPVLLSVSGLPPETSVSIGGKKYLTTDKRGEYEVGQFAPGSYMLALNGPYMQPEQIPVTLEADKPVMLNPPVTELGKLQIRTGISGPGTSVLAVLHADTAGTADTECRFDSRGIWEGFLQPGTYTIRARKSDDISDGYTETVSVTGGTVHTATIPEISYSSSWQIEKLKAEKSKQEKRLEKVPSQQKAFRTAGWGLLGAGIAFSVVSTWAYFSGRNSYADYQDADASGNISSLKNTTERYSLVFSSCAITAGISLLLSPAAFHLAPDGEKIEASIAELDRQIQKLAEEQGENGK